ncbi:2652_t:CDS:10 [Entrophospora sp. SA101]|nr:2652_t:CDS:10 [Entrophospora sp. SA101]
MNISTLFLFAQDTTDHQAQIQPTYQLSESYKPKSAKNTTDEILNKSATSSNKIVDSPEITKAEKIHKLLDNYKASLDEMDLNYKSNINRIVNRIAERLEQRRLDKEIASISGGINTLNINNPVPGPIDTSNLIHEIATDDDEYTLRFENKGLSIDKNSIKIIHKLIIEELTCLGLLQSEGSYTPSLSKETSKPSEFIMPQIFNNSMDIDLVRIENAKDLTAIEGQIEGGSLDNCIRDSVHCQLVITTPEEQNQSRSRSRSPVQKIKNGLHLSFFNNSSSKRKSQVANQLTSEQENKIDQLKTFLEGIGSPLENEQLQKLLKANNWDVSEVANYYKSLADAEEGLIADVKKGVIMTGSENDRSTSCYIDSLLFAMFARIQSFDGLLYMQAGETNAKILQTHLRLFVNRLRTGELINEYMVKVSSNIRMIDDYGRPTQEDSSELFLFLSYLYELPYLPLEMHLIHGAKRDPMDERVVTERMIQIAIPGEPKDETPVTLEEALKAHFYDNSISGIKRKLLPEENVDLAGDEKTKGKIQLSIEQSEIPVTAWQVLKLLPFYSASNEQDERIKVDQSYFPTTNLLLPLVLKRYGFNESLRPFRIKKNVYIPPFANFNLFVNSDAADEQPYKYGIDNIHYKLKLRSVVCHYGESLYSGHYKGFTLDDILNPDEVDEDKITEHDYYVAQNLQQIEFLDGKNKCVLQ